MGDLDLVDVAVDYARSKGAAYAEARYEQQFREAFILKNGNVDVSENTEDEGIGVRVLAGGTLGFACTNLLTKAEIRGVVDEAIRSAKAAKRKVPITFAPEPAATSNWSVPEGKKLVDVPAEDKIAVIQDIDKKLVGLKYKIPGRFFATTCTRIVKYFVNSEGSKIRSYSPRVRFHHYLTVLKGGDAEQSYRNYGWSGGWEALDAWKLEDRVLEEARTCIDGLEHGKKSPEGRMDLVVGPPVAGIMAHESCGHPTEADRVLGR